MGSWLGKIRAQLINLPMRIEARDRLNAGIVIFLSKLLIWCRGEDKKGDQVTEIKNRIE